MAGIGYDDHDDGKPGFFARWFESSRNAMGHVTLQESQGVKGQPLRHDMTQRQDF